jgi:hypothetical protein
VAIMESCNVTDDRVVFSRCAGSLEEGRRLENLTWRLWNRETFCCEPGEANSTTPAISISARSSEGRYTADIPDLSGSVDSLADEEAIEFDSEEASSTSAPLKITRPHLERQDSSTIRSRGRERHITPDDLEKMVYTIKEKKDLEPLTIRTHPSFTRLASVAEIPTPTPTATIPIPTVAVEENVTMTTAAAEVSSDTSSPAQNSDSVSGTSERSTTSVVRGFSPSHISSSYRSTPLLEAPASLPKSALATHSRTPVLKKHVFALGGSSDDSFNEESSLDSRMQSQPQIKKKSTVFTFGGSSGEEENSLRENMQPAQVQRSSLSEALRGPIQKKQTSFKEEVATRTILDNDVFEDTEEEDEVDESAIDDDDDESDWEDSIEESGRSSIDDKTFFQRVDSRPNLTSRRSLITTMLHQNERAAALANAASKSTPALKRSRTSSPNGPSLAVSPESDDAAPLMMKKGTKPGQDVPRSSAQPIIMTTTNVTPHQAALSPKTTRRNMMQTELTASLRRHLLWERQQKNQTAAAVLKRRHTAHDVANLKQYPEKVHLGTDDKDNYGSWNQYFGQGLGDFHSKGW